MLRMLLQCSVAVMVSASCATRDATSPSIGPAASLTVVSGNMQSALAGTALSNPIRFRLADGFGNGIPNATVVAQVTAGEGSVASGASSFTTDASGIATLSTWMLGKLAIPQALSASFGALSVSATATVTTQFHAEVRFFGAPLASNYLPAFARALARLDAEVVGALSPVTLANQPVATDCDAGGVAPLSETISSTVIYVSVGVMDGPGGIVAASGPCYIRQADKLTVVGTILLDESDLPAALSNGQLEDVVFHEMQHVLGFGTLWNTVSPTLIINAGMPNSGFVGHSGIHGCHLAGAPTAACDPSIPLESFGGDATADGHWRQSIFGNELMTGSVGEPGTRKPLSSMTIGSLTDIGYQTNGNVADPYSVTSDAIAAISTLRLALHEDALVVRERLLRPRFSMSRVGEVTRIR